MMDTAAHPRPLRDGSQHKHERFTWLTPPSFAESIKIADIVAAPTPQARAARVTDYVRTIWSIWRATDHAETIVQWYERYIVPERI